MAVTLDKIKHDVAGMLETDENVRFVDVLADTLDDALADAAVQLDTKVNLLEYEVLEKGSNGFLGFVKKNWKIRAYELAASTAQSRKEAENVAEQSENQEAIAEIVDKDGKFFVHHFDSNICLKVVLPVGKGDRVDYKEIYSYIKSTGSLNIDEDKIKNAVKNGTDEKYVIVGLYKHNSDEDAAIVIDISNDDLHATATISAPGDEGAEVSEEKLRRTLTTQGVLAGFNEEVITDFIDNPSYGVPIEVASAIPPQDGKNAYIKYNFETDRSKLRAKESKTGQMNFKELNIIQNVVEGQPLGQKIPAERGKSGKTLSGRLLEAKDGRDIKMPLGQNVYVDADGVTICAKCNGQVVLNGDIISVEPVYLVEGNVGIKTGNISFLGKVIVKGTVEDGYNIKASGDIEVSGLVGKCILESDGNVVLNQGIIGGDEGSVRAGKSMWAKFIQNTKVDIDEDLFITDYIMNSEVTCNRKVFIDGKRAAIIGSHIFATECVYTKNIGTVGGGSIATVEVGVAPKQKLRLVELQNEQSNIVAKMEDLDLNITNLENQKKVRKRLPLDKEKLLEELTSTRMEMITKSDEMSDEIKQIQDKLRELKAVGKVCVSGTVYSGSKIYVRDVIDDVHADLKGVTFYWENGFVKRGKYEPPDETEAKRMPDGYSTN